MLFALLSVSFVLMKDHYEYFQQKSVSTINSREKLAFFKYKLSMTNWLVFITGVALFLLSFQAISIGIILFFYVYLLHNPCSRASIFKINSALTEFFYFLK